jgi:hypothetical protein
MRLCGDGMIVQRFRFRDGCFEVEGGGDSEAICCAVQAMLYRGLMDADFRDGVLRYLLVWRLSSHRSGAEAVPRGPRVLGWGPPLGRFLYS